MNEFFENENLISLKYFARKNFIPVLLDDTANLLYQCITQNQPKTVLEIGTAIGYSGAILLAANETCKLVTIEKDENNYNLAKENFSKFELSTRVTQILGDAKNEIVKLCNNNCKFDFIFLDGPKGQYLAYLPTLKQMLNENGILFSDNVLFKGLVNGPEFVPHRKRTIVVNLRKFLNELKVDNDFVSNTYEIGDGVNISKLIHKG